jgi:hypothetical protein
VINAWNVPDGNWSFPGDHDLEIIRQCGAEGVFKVLLTDVSDLLRDAQLGVKKVEEGDPHRTYQGVLRMLMQRLETEIKYAPEVVADCPFDGEVVVDRRYPTWECPVCGTEHDEATE